MAWIAKTMLAHPPLLVDSDFLESACSSFCGVHRLLLNSCRVLDVVINSLMNTLPCRWASSESKLLSADGAPLQKCCTARNTYA